MVPQGGKGNHNPGIRRTRKSLFFAVVNRLYGKTGPAAILLLTGAVLSGCHASKKAGGTEIPQRRHIVSYARQFLSTPYTYGGISPEGGFDCSGFVNYVYAHYGIKLPRTSAALAYAGKTIPLDRAHIADLILFTGSNASGPVGHVGIICRADGPNTEFIHASSGARSGGVIISALSNSYYKQRFVKVVNVLQ